MHDSLNKFLERTKETGSLALFANLLFDAVILGWLVFAGLYALEALLPTFIIARLSLVKFSIILIALTALLTTLRTSLPPARFKKTSDSWFLWTAITFLVGTITIAHYRFPWWSIPLCVIGYILIAWLFLKNLEKE
jgi:hypothetical protein